MDSSGTLQSLVQHFMLAVEPLAAAVSDVAAFRTFLLRLGWDVKSLPPEYAALAAKVAAARTALDALGDDPQPSEIFAALDAVKQVYAALKAIGTAPEGVDAQAFLADISRDIFDLLLAEYLEDACPRIHATLLALDILTHSYTAQTPGRPAVLLNRFHWEEVPKVLADPASIAARVYGWGSDDLQFHRLAGHLLEFFVGANFPAYLERVEPAFGRGFLESPEDFDRNIEWALKLPVIMESIGGQTVEVGLALLELPAEAGKPAGVIVQPLVPSGIGTSHPLTDTLRLELKAGSDIGTAFGVLLRPDDISVRFPLQQGSALPDAGFEMTLRYAPESPTQLLGAAGRSRLELKGAATSVAVDLHAGELELRLQAATEELKLIVAASDLDGFLGELFGSGDRTIPIVLGAQWSSRTGFNFSGGAGFEISTHPHLSLGPIRIERLDIAVTAAFESGAPPEIKAQVGTVVTGSLGPVTFSAEGLGVALTLRFSEGNAGPFDIDYGFSPPRGLGIAVHAGPIAGGGFLSFDKEHGRYAGALELKVFNISVKAIGFVETQLPNGAPGYSFLILIAAEFNPIQLGLGFTLNGVGGLVAIHRRLDVEALRGAMLSGSVDDILYPRDPIGDAPRIISQLGIIFPAAHNHYVFAPTALIGWGTPTLIRAQVGMVFEPSSPFRVTLLGLISSMLPTEDAPIVELHVAVLGNVDFVRLRLAIDATLYHSSVAGFPLTGDMAVRIAWGLPPSIVVAMGGLNPHFEPPADFPSLERLTIVIGSGDNPRLTCQAYLAMTSNTVQFGVRAELYAAAAGFNIRGWVNFDCLIQLLPLSLLADLGAEVALRRGSHVLASVHLEATISGPAPWHVWGKASLSLWLFDVTVRFDVTFGIALPVQLPLLNPWPLLLAAIQDVRNWSVSLATGIQGVTLRTVSGENAPVLMDPGGAATIRQTVVPLNRKITRFGAAKPEGPDRYSVTAVNMNSATPAFEPVTEYFAAAQFDELSDTEKLSRPSFEQMDSGMRIGGDTLATGPAVGATLRYETIIIDRPWQRRPGPLHTILQDVQLLMLEQGASGRTPPRKPSKVSLDDDAFVIATADAVVVPGLSSATTKGAALAALADHLALHPQLRGQLQVMPEYEAVATP